MLRVVQVMAHLQLVPELVELLSGVHHANGSLRRSLPKGVLPECFLGSTCLGESQEADPLLGFIPRPPWNLGCTIGEIMLEHMDIGRAMRLLSQPQVRTKYLFGPHFGRGLYG